MSTNTTRGKLFQVLSEEASASRFLQEMVEAKARSVLDVPEDSDPDNIPWSQFFRQWITVASQVHLKKIFTKCQSPIERAFWISLHGCFLVNNGMNFCIESAPSGDVEEGLAESRDFLERSFQPYLFYRNLPEDARPASYEEFLRYTSNSPDAYLDEKSIQILWQRSTYDYEFCQHFAFRVALQPKFQNFYGGGRYVRTDALIWIPANPAVKVIIECDGFDYHKNRESFTADRQRDRRFAEKGYVVRRYSGSEIVNDLANTSADLYRYLTSTFQFGPAYRETWKREFSERYLREIMPSPDCIASWRETLSSGVTV